MKLKPKHLGGKECRVKIDVNLSLFNEILRIGKSSPKIEPCQVYFSCMYGNW